jgi:hypothetical protein
LPLSLWFLEELVEEARGEAILLEMKNILMDIAISSFV